MNIKKAIIPAAGYGTRNLPITKVIPKEMFPIKGKPAIHYIVEEAASSGIEEILIIVSRNKNMIIDYFDRSLELEAFLEKNNKLHLLENMSIPNLHVQFVRQPFAKGLGDAIKLGKTFINDEPFAILLPDDLFIGENPSLQSLIDQYKKIQANVIGLKKIDSALIHNYGVIDSKRINRHLHEITNLIEKPQTAPPSNLAIVGRYVLHPTIFDYLNKGIEGTSGEIQLTDALRDMLSAQKCYGYELKEDRYDIGSEIEYFNLLKRLYKE